jgi:hypothetical protein
MTTNTYLGAPKRVIAITAALIMVIAAIGITLWLTLAPASSDTRPSSPVPAVLGGGGHAVAK